MNFLWIESMRSVNAHVDINKASNDPGGLLTMRDPMVMESDMIEHHAAKVSSSPSISEASIIVDDPKGILQVEYNVEALGFTTSTPSEPIASVIRKLGLFDISIPIDLNLSDDDLEIPDELEDTNITKAIPISLKGSEQLKFGDDGTANTSTEVLEDWEDSTIAQ